MFRSSIPARRRSQRGVTRPALAVVVLLLVLAGVFVHAWWQRIHRDASLPPSPVTSAAAGSVARPAEALPPDALLRAARADVAAQHLLAPVGDNAFERYLVLRAQPSSRGVADDALRELFPYAADHVAATIRDGHTDEAKRELDLLARADPANYTLTLLRNQLAAQEAQLAATAAAATTANSPSAAVPAPRREPPAPTVAAVPVPESRSPASTMPVPPPVARIAPSPKPAAAPAPRVTPPVLLRRVEPYYPQAARRARRQGWVELAFTVLPDGRVDAVRVLQAEPGSMFDLAATTAVRRWTFKPATRDGRPIAMDLHQRLDFRL
ncbi:energy transducer TonB [Dyella lutea]|uniref:Protein TonB n=1 Tax=Dyella lutea TaxID=2950441 RepID=A0ABT1F612_9GAMM|nr:energy transducer TonB [Dyella lutea]MCP1372772.1 energy transducer TonB [Dyella lutea]